MGVMVSATNLISLYVGLELQQPRGLCARLLPPHRRAFGRGGPQIFRARRARQRHPALRHFAALRLHRHDQLHRHRRRVRRAARRRSACCSAWCSCSPASPSRSARCRSTCGRRTSTKARRRRSPPSSPRRPRSPACCSRRASCVDGARPGDRRLAPDRDLRRAGLDLPRRDRRFRPDQHQAAARLFVDQQCRLRAGRPRRRRRRRARRRCCSTWRSMS